MATKELIRESIPTALFAPPGSLNRVTGSRGGLRYYEHGGTGAKLPSVTTIMGKAIRKEGLEWWKDGMIRSGLKSHMGETIDDDLIKDVTGKARREGKKAADLGSELHSLVDHILKGMEPDSISPQLEPAINGFIEFQNAQPWTFLESETAVFFQGQTTYAGTVDALFENPNGTLVVVDLKSGDIYPEAKMQVSAYARAITAMTGLPTTGMVVSTANTKDENGDKVFSGEINAVEVRPELWLPGFDGACYVYEALNREVA